VKKAGTKSAGKSKLLVGQNPTRKREIVIEGRPGYYGMFGYRSATVASREGRSYSAASGERHEKYHRTKLINQSRDFMRNNAIYKGMIEKSVSYIVGDGFTLQIRTKNKTFNTDAEQLWKQHHRWPEIRHLLTGKKTDRMVLREILTAGDTAAILVRGGLIQLIEAEQIASKSNADGIEKNDVGRPTKFWICPYNKNGMADTRHSKSYKPKDVLFITNPERASSIRGVPPCQSAFPMLHRINDVCDSEAIAWQLLARFAIINNRKEGAGGAYNFSKADPNKTGTAAAGSITTRITEMGYAIIVSGDPNDEIKGIERNIPGKNFSESLRTFLRLLGLPLGLPLEIILLDWTKSNYSQSRAVLEQAYEMFLDYQDMLEDYYYRPLVEWKLNQWLSEKKLKLSKNEIIKFDFIKPIFPWIDQLKEAQAYGAKVDRGFTTHQNVCKALKTEREDVVEAREAEIKDAIERVQRIKNETGQEVPWQIFAGLEPPNNKINLVTEKDKTKQTKDENEEKED